RTVEPDCTANGPAISVGVAPSLKGAHNNGLLCGLGGAHRGLRGETEPCWGTISRFYDARYRLAWCRNYRRWSEAVCSHPRQSTTHNAGQRDALLPILVTDALTAAQRDRDRAPPSDGLGGMAGVRQATGRPRGGWLGSLEKFADGRIAIARRRPRDVAGW